ncbi:MAG: hypothetical protein AAGD32_08190 [Planctomycetota bacterium]
MQSVGVLLISIAVLLGALTISAGGSAAVIAIVVFSTFYVVPGTLLIITSIYLKRYQTWAVIVGLVLTSLLLLGCLMIIAGGLINVLLVDDGDVNIGGYVMLGVGVLFLIAFSQLLYLLIKSFDVIRMGPEDNAPRGFEPIMPTSVEPDDQTE